MNSTESIQMPKILSDSGVAAALEAKRLAEKYQKDFFDCDDLVDMMRVGKNNIRQLMRSKTFPTIEIGNRKVVSALGLALWLINQESNLSDFP